MEYRGQVFDVPSKLAVEVINSNGTKTKAVNGYDYLMVRSSNGLVPLGELRIDYFKIISAHHLTKSPPNSRLERTV